MTRATLHLTANDFEAPAQADEAGGAAKRSTPSSLATRALGWSAGAVARLGAAGLSLLARAPHDGCLATLELVRAGEHAGAALKLRVDERGVEIAITVPRDELREALAVDARGVAASVAALPEQFLLGGAPCADATEARIAEVAAEPSPIVSMSWLVPRATALEHLPHLEEQLEDALVALGPVFAAVARVDAPRDVALAPAASTARLERGARVRVRSGPFADQIGTVSENDGRGVRVLLGLLSSRFAPGALEPAPEGRARGAFQSSHRRPVPPGTRKAR